MFALIKKMFIGLLNSIVNASNHTRCISLNNQQYMNQPTLINLNSNGYIQGFHYYLFVVNLERCMYEVVILLILLNYLTELEFQTKQKI